MELCNTCKNTSCSKNIEVIKEEDIVTIKCVDYEKDESKIQGYKKPLNRTARQCNTLMKLNI